MHNNSLFHQLFDFILERSFEEPAKSLSGDRYCKFSNSRSIPGPVYGGLNDPNAPSKSRAQNSKKKTLNSEKENKVEKKNPGIELLSHTLLCSTIVVRPLIDRVRDGNVSFKPAIDTGKKYIRKKEEERGEEECCKYNVCCLIC